MTDPHQRLQNALDALDVAFAPLADLPFPVSGCTYCYAESDLEAVAGPVDLVPEDLIPYVAHEATNHWDDFPGLYRRLTPRIVRALTEGRLLHNMVASRFLAAGWRAWPAPERAALEEVWHAWWRSALHSHPGTTNIRDVLEVLAVTTGTLTPWLTEWAATRTEASDRHLADALGTWLIEDDIADLQLGFYDEVYAAPELLRWLCSLERGRVNAAQLKEIERIVCG
ncbi:hypothetical protein ACH4D5_25675 [Streptomyces sp. NPDC018029]|uniref:hypothetical protein n=1 Tax=Streptomyces sp. NPDC018029 TaxID=3365032 RepID=UPI00378B269B